MNLYAYIKQDFIRNTFNESCIIISNINESEKIAIEVSMGASYNIIFETSSLKNRFFSVLREQRGDICIINCDSMNDRFVEDLNNSYGLVVFDNVNKCKNLSQFNYIKTNKVIIC